VELVATTGDAVLAGDASAGNDDGINVDRILSPNLTVRALQGNIFINNNFVLFPSSTGNLVLSAFGNITNSLPTTTFVPTDSVPPDPNPNLFFSSAPNFAPNGFPTIYVSDADPLRQNPPPMNTDSGNFLRDFFRYYAEIHATSPIHTGDATPINIATDRGDVSRLAFVFPKFSKWDIGGNLGLIGFEGQNLSPTDVTSFDIQGNLDWSRKIMDVDGRQVIVNGNVADPFATKIQVDGPGKLDIKVSEFADLGDSEGILTTGRLFNRNLYDPTPGDGFQSDLTDDGASINMCVGPGTCLTPGVPGELEPPPPGPRQNFTLVNSRLTTLQGGNIDVTVNDGSLFVGQGTLGSTGSLLARGIYSATGGNINLAAWKNVNVLTSRVGSFNGGNINITAVTGSINAGEGKLTQPSDVPSIGTGGVALQISGTGIITSTIPCVAPDCIQPPIPARPGQITLKAPNIITGSAGITCKGNSSACNVNIIGNVTLGTGGITSAGNINITGSVTGTGNISGGAVNISGTTGAGASVSASSGSGAVTAAAVSTPVTTETSQAAKVASAGEGMGTGEGDDASKKKRRKAYIRRGVIIEVTGRPAA
jgi:hypothetical protein